MINLVGPSDGRYNKHLDSTVLVHLTYCKLFMPYLQRWSLILHFFYFFRLYNIFRTNISFHRGDDSKCLGLQQKVKMDALGSNINKRRPIRGVLCEH